MASLYLLVQTTVGYIAHLHRNVLEHSFDKHREAIRIIAEDQLNAFVIIIISIAISINTCVAHNSMTVETCKSQISGERSSVGILSTQRKRHQNNTRGMARPEPRMSTIGMPRYSEEQRQVFNSSWTTTAHAILPIEQHGTRHGTASVHGYKRFPRKYRSCIYIVPWALWLAAAWAANVTNATA